MSTDGRATPLPLAALLLLLPVAGACGDDSGEGDGGDGDGDGSGEASSGASGDGDAGNGDSGDGDSGGDDGPAVGPGSACSEDGECDDGKRCNGSERCVEERCEAGEALDDGQVCAVQDGSPGSCRGGLCVASSCQDGELDEGEQCDDGQESGACDVDCTPAECGDGVLNTTAGEACDDGRETATCNADCSVARCGDGVLNSTAGESCDGGGETAECDLDCSARQCGDGVVNATAGETCDDAGESRDCDADCTIRFCGDGTVNATAGETCDDGGESTECDRDCSARRCGDGFVNATAGEACDAGGESAACDADCTLRECGDGTINASAGETCDPGSETSTCDLDCTARSCGDGVVNATAGEQCDDGGESALCDADCSLAECGDMVVNGSAGEACDPGSETTTCNADCTARSCGDGVLNATAGEQCDDGADGDPDDGCDDSCSFSCEDQADCGALEVCDLYRCRARRFTLPVRINTGSSAVWPHVAMDGRGGAHALWTDSDDDLGRRAEHDGSGWLAPVALESPPHQSGEGHVASDMAGNLVLAWPRADTTGDVRALRVVDGFGPQPVETVGSGTANLGGVRASVLPDGVIGVSWTEEDTTTDIVANLYDGGWGSAAPLEAIGSAFGFDSWSAAAGSGLAVWISGDGSEIYASTLTGSWSTATSIYTAPVDTTLGFFEVPRVALAGNDDALMIWTEEALDGTQEALIRGYDADGAGWGSVASLLVDDTKTHFAAGDVALNGAGDGLVAWLEYSYPGANLSYSLRAAPYTAASGLGAAVELGASSWNALPNELRVAVDASGNGIVVFLEPRANLEAYTFVVGSGFSELIPLEVLGGNVHDFDLSMQPDGHATVVWTQRVGNATQVFASRFE